MVLVTGGTGMLGSFIVRELRGRGRPARVLARAASAGVARQHGVEVAIGDLLEGWDRGPFVFISSVSVYGRSLWLPTTEDHPLNDASGYGLGKIRCEALLAAAAATRHRQDWSTLRPPHIWAPDRRSIAHEASPVGELYRRAANGQPLVLPGATEAEWSTYGDDWVDARELAWAAVECLDRPLSGPANAVNSHFIWHDFCAELIRLTGSRSSMLHEPMGSPVFAQPWTYSGARYHNQHLRQALVDCFGSHTLGDLRRKVLMAAFDLDNRSVNLDRPRMWKPKFFHNFSGDDSDAAERIVDVALRSSAAPTYFPVYQGYVDGFVVANNPSMCAVAQAMGAETRSEAAALEDIVLLSVGTGLNLRYLPQEDADWGLRHWAFQVQPLQRQCPCPPLCLHGSICTRLHKRGILPPRRLRRCGGAAQS